ncbi:MAG: S-methyl-5-thioribose-1-phosphate isomerase [Oscillibacter sp.]
MENIRYDRKNEALYILDQTLLPGEEREIRLETAREMFDAIQTLQVRGAPAIGICAGYCMYVLARSIRTEDRQVFLKQFSDYGQYLDSSRPTAVNLHWAIRSMLRCALEQSGSTRGQLLDALYENALAIHRDDRDKCAKIAALGLQLVKDGDGILTHCNAGPLATSQYGTALGPILLGTERGMKFKVFADETRPLLQGARLTSYELARAGVDVTLICDNMASMVMKNGWVQACFVGCDRVAANGDTANKIGTSGVAILAKHYGIPFYVLGPSSTIDMDCPTGAEIPIELRDPEEIKTKFYTQPMALAEVKCYNPAFDVTDHSLIAGIVTERGICRPPYTKSLAALFQTGANP